MIKTSLCLAVLVSSAAVAVTPYYSIRSQSENIAREMVGAGWNTQINLCDMDEWYGNFSITPEWTSSFRSRYIAESLFGCNNCCLPCNTSCNTSCDTSCCSPCGPCWDNNCDDNYRVRVTGSQVAERGANDWLADNFGLPVDYKSCVTFEPKIDNFLVDFNFYLGLDEWCQGMYFRIHAPVVYTRWDLNMCECVEAQGEGNHPVGYFNKTVNGEAGNYFGIARNNLVSNFTSFISGCGVINSNDIAFNPLCYAKMDSCRRTETALADIRMALGWNFWCDECYHVGLGIYAAAPTGNKVEGNYLFEPVVGNGKHWELGGQFTSHWTFWTDECEERSCAFYLDANISHMFKAKQCRVFDLCGKPLSRYMLASKFKTPVEGLYAGDTPDVPSKQFAGIYSPVANLTYMPVDVSVGVQGDLALMFQYNHCNWSFDLGYNFWGRSCDKIECRCDCCPTFEENTWALKGDAYMYGFDTEAIDNDDVGVALSASQSLATIYAGKNTPAATDASPWYKNASVDNAQLAWNNSAGDAELYTLDSVGANAEQVYTSLDPVFIKFNDFDLCGARTKGLSHKLFVNFDYTWCDHECWVPYLGIGGEVEFAQKPCDDCCNDWCNPCGTSCSPCDTACSPCYSNCCDDNCCNDSCCTAAVSQWGIWLKGGVAFN